MASTGQQPIPNPSKREEENLREYHKLQYERIDKLESQRYNFSNLILTITIAATAFGYKDATAAINNDIQKIVIPFIIILANFLASVYQYKSRLFIKMHKARAREARMIYAPELEAINKQIGKINGDKDWLRRPLLYIYLHIICMVVGVYIFLLFKINFTW